MEYQFDDLGRGVRRKGERVNEGSPRFERLEERVTDIEKREAARDVKVEIATTAMNRLAGLVGAAGIAVLGAVIAFVLGAHG